MTCCGVSAACGACPVSISYSTQPWRRRRCARRLQRSRWLLGARRAASDGESDDGDPLAAGLLDGASDAEVGDHRVPLREENVLGLDVAMHDVASVGVRERLADFASDAYPRRSPTTCLRGGGASQRLAVDVRHDVETVGRRPVEDRQDVRMHRCAAIVISLRNRSAAPRGSALP